MHREGTLKRRETLAIGRRRGGILAGIDTDIQFDAPLSTSVSAAGA
jgi:hypothetical protein